MYMYIHVYMYMCKYYTYTLHNYVAAPHWNQLLYTNVHTCMYMYSMCIYMYMYACRWVAIKYCNNNIITLYSYEYRVLSRPV